MISKQTAELLEEKYLYYNQPSFIERDPISIPHAFTKKEDIEIAGFFAALLAWGRRDITINNCKKLMQLMDQAPHQFVLHHTDNDLKPMQAFVHRTFNATDLLYIIDFLKRIYSSGMGLEGAFCNGASNVYAALLEFKKRFADSSYYPTRTGKHISSPVSGSACKRLNMYLRWMVRKDDKGVDLGLWKSLSPTQLICPVDVHVGCVARKLGLIARKQNDWKTAVELSEVLRTLDPADPVKYDFALFGMGEEGFCTQ